MPPTQRFTRPRLAHRHGHRRALFACLALLLCAGLVVACGGRKGPPKKKQVLLKTEYHDEMVGDENAKMIESEMGLVKDPELVEYVTAIGRRMVPYAPQRTFDYQFSILDQSSPNAFALPGGHIYVSRGLLALTNSEDELACVIGHEITHSAERHAASQQEAARRLNPLSMGYVRAGLIASYGRNQERDADRGGQTMAAKAGFDPIGMSTFLSDLGMVERLALGWSRLPSYFASHPGTSERAATAASRAENLSWTRKPGVAKDQADFLKKLEGIVVGQNPREGVFIDGRFFHPDMGFTLRFPKDWGLVNTSRAVGAVSPRHDAEISLAFAGIGDDPEAVAHVFMEGPMKEQHGEVHRMLPMKIGDYDAFRIDVQTGGRGQNLISQITFIAYDGVIFRLTAISPASQNKKYKGRFQATARTFRAMTDEERALIFVERVHIVPSLQGETLEMLSVRTGNAMGISETGVLNDIFLGQRLRAGHLVKITRAEPYVPKPPETRETQAPEPIDGATKD